MEMQHDDSKCTIIEKNDGFSTRKQSTDKISEIKAGNKFEFQDIARNGQFVQNGYRNYNILLKFKSIKSTVRKTIVNFSHQVDICWSYCRYADEEYKTKVDPEIVCLRLLIVFD